MLTDGINKPHRLHELDGRCKLIWQTLLQLFQKKRKKENVSIKWITHYCELKSIMQTQYTHYLGENMRYFNDHRGAGDTLHCVSLKPRLCVCLQGQRRGGGGLGPHSLFPECSCGHSVLKSSMKSCPNQHWVQRSCSPNNRAQIRRPPTVSGEPS